MNTDVSPHPLPFDAPPIIRDLRDAFDARLLDLFAVVRDQTAGAPLEAGHDGSPMRHVDFPHGVLQVTAVYDAGSDRFTQLVARYADEAHLTRPSFTISLFL